jgi:uncharacterized protein YodC (DUF2158 family)
MSKGDKRNGDKLWGRFWSEQGVAVVHVDKLKVDPDIKLEDLKMRIEEPVYINKKVQGEVKQFLTGIKCHWLDKDMKIQRAVYHSCELIPYDIAKEGFQMINKWLERKY